MSNLIIHSLANICSYTFLPHGAIFLFQKSLLHINCIISSTWIEPQELKFLISAISNVGAVCYNNGWLEKVCMSLVYDCNIFFPLLASYNMEVLYILANFFVFFFIV